MFYLKMTGSRSALPTINRRTFLQVAAHLSLLSVTQAISHPRATRAVQTASQADSYGSGMYGEGVYLSASREAGDYLNYLPIVSKKE
jgi:hypothetical protein